MSSVTSPERKDRLLGCKISRSDGLVVEYAARLERTTVSAFIREAVLPVARDTIVKHAVEAPQGDAA